MEMWLAVYSLGLEANRVRPGFTKRMVLFPDK
jgi:hypothetical protein